MFSLILKNCGFRRTFQPVLIQSRDFKREVVPSDLDINHPDSPFKKIREEIEKTDTTDKTDTKDKIKNIDELWSHNEVDNVDFFKLWYLDIPDGTHVH